MSRAEEKPFRLRAGEPIGDGLRRIARHEVDAVIEALRRPMGEETVHEVRKATKRLRALLSSRSSSKTASGFPTSVMSMACSLTRAAAPVSSRSKAREAFSLPALRVLPRAWWYGRKQE